MNCRRSNLRFVQLTMLILLGSLLAVPVLANEIDTLDRMIDEGDFEQALQQAEEIFRPEEPRADILSKMAKAYHEMGEVEESKKTRKKLYKECLEFFTPYMETAEGSERDRAFLVYWCAVFTSKYAEERGILNSLFKIPDVVDLADQAIAIDPTFAYPYFLKGMIYKNVPIGQYSDKFEMSVNLAQAVKYDSENIFFMVEVADAISQRGWTVAEKEKQAIKRDLASDGTPMNLSDQEYALKLVEEAIQVYHQMENPLAAEEEVYTKANELLTKLKK